MEGLLEGGGDDGVVETAVFAGAGAAFGGAAAAFGFGVGAGAFLGAATFGCGFFAAGFGAVFAFSAGFDAFGAGLTGFAAFAGLDGLADGFAFAVFATFGALVTASFLA